MSDSDVSGLLEQTRRLQALNAELVEALIHCEGAMIGKVNPKSEVWTKIRDVLAKAEATRE